MTAEPHSGPATEPEPESSAAAEPESRAAAEPVVSRWPMPPQDGYRVDDLFELPDLPPHTELIDGSLVFVSPQRDFHGLTVDLLVQGLRRVVPAELRVRREMTVVLSDRTAPEPDISVVRAEAVTGRLQSSFQAADVVLAVEVVSPESRERDRDTKPHKYARAGIPHYWRVEMTGEDALPAVYAYELDEVTGVYAISGVHHDQLKVTVPFHVDIDLTQIEHL